MDNDDSYSEYKFAKANAFLEHSNPFEEGLKRLQAHDIVNAVLLFEAAVQKQSNHIDVRITNTYNNVFLINEAFSCR
jgi:tRNA (Thr-GGU) A37 N-methylase